MIKVKVNLYAELIKYSNGKKETLLKVDEDCDIRYVIAKLGIPYEEVSMCIVNNIPVSKEKVLANDDTLKLIPPITGG